MILKPYAADPIKTLGRQYEESKSNSRNDFQRDRDRIIHSSAFRRLEYKTQVFVNHEGDMFRTRLTHSIEVSQISRGISRTLGCHEDLAETIALAHDLGHTPFGHAGQDSLNNCMKVHGGFEHNLQSLRVVDYLERRYASFDGLNLTFESREGILKHCSVNNAKTLGLIGDRFIKKQQPSLEAQIVNIADEIAYNNHDVDDGYRSGLLDFKALIKNTLFGRCAKEVDDIYSDINDSQKINEVVRRMIHILIEDVCSQSQKNLDFYQPKSIDDVRISPHLIDFSASIKQEQQELKQFLRHAMYEHPHVAKMTQNAGKTIEKLFAHYIKEPKAIPENFSINRTDNHQRVVADYIAGMTDRFAIKAASKL
ncbi:MAG: deoxyguanosinetriphosphate triphosphohydrolase [Methylophilaceae bacterium]|jgi:dGTPase|nr:deoxyguanosinetriphosphate triphosphohydrolase [Methylophilaceae bacterium]